MADEKPQKRPVSGMMLGSSRRDVMGPMMIDQSLRQVITHCWMILPEDRRTPDEIEKEMMRLLKRALKDLREDAASFGFDYSDK